MSLPLIALFLAAFMSVLDGGVVYVGLPAIERSLNVGIADQQWILGIYVLMQGSFTLAAGTLGDLYGRRRIFLAGVALFALGSVTCALAPSGAVLILARALQGVGGSVLFSLSLAIGSTLVASGEKEKLVRNFANVASLGAVMAPLLGGILVSALGWRSIFFINVPIAALVTWVVVTQIKESTVDRVRRLDLQGQFCSLAGVFAISYVLTEGNAMGWTSVPTFAITACGVALLAWFLHAESRSPDPMVLVSYLRDPSFAAAAIAIVINALQYYGIYLIATNFLQDVRGENALVTGLLLAPTTLVFFLINMNCGLVTKRIGLEATAAVGTGIETASVVLILLLGQTTNPIAMTLILALWCAGAALAYTPAMTLGMSRVPQRDVGMASGLLTMGTSLGGVVGIGLVGSVLAAGMVRAMQAAFVGSSVAPDLQNAILTATHHGGAWSVLQQPQFDPVRAPLAAIVNGAFVAGMHGAAIAVAVVSGVSTAAVVWLLLAGRGKRDLPAAAQS
jgi:EmrB/QacA subfamily drug resistance transporter